MQANTQSIPTVTVQSGRPSSKIEISAEAQQEVRAAYLSAHRQRFKAEINRLTGGAMSQMLQQKSVLPDEAAQLGFMMSYLYAWYWLQQNVNTEYQSDVLSSFAKGAQAFLMEMLLDSKTASDFTQAYIKYWQQYQGESQLQQQNCLQLLQEKGGVQALTEHINTGCGVHLRVCRPEKSEDPGVRFPPLKSARHQPIHCRWRFQNPDYPYPGTLLRVQNTC